MTQQSGKDKGLLETIQSEVGSDTSPLLAFLTNHAKTIIIAFIGSIVGIAAFWTYSSSQQEKRVLEQWNLGEVIAIVNDQERLAALKEYVQKAPAETRMDALVALVQTAKNLGDSDTAIAAWKQVADKDATMIPIATLGIADLYEQQGKWAEALAELDAVLPKVANEYKAVINEAIAVAAEELGKYDRAAVAADEIIVSGIDADARVFWQQKLAAYKEKIPPQENTTPEAQ